MNALATIVMFFALAAPPVGGNVCWNPAVADVTLSFSEPTRLKLEASRVAGLAERGFLYNLGREKILIKTNRLATEGFLNAVLSGSCSVTVDVVLIPSGETRDGKLYTARLVKEQKAAVTSTATTAKTSEPR